MKLSDLIARAAELMQKHGDCDVMAQYQDAIEGKWWFANLYIEKVHGNNSSVVVQMRHNERVNQEVFGESIVQNMKPLDPEV